MAISLKEIWPIENVYDYKVHFASVKFHSKSCTYPCRLKLENWQNAAESLFSAAS